MSETQETSKHDVIIIGSGPAGYTAAIYLGRAGYRPLIIAGALTPGGQLVNTSEVENFPGFPEGILGPELMDRMREQAEKFGAVIEYDDVTSVDFSGDEKTLHTDSGTDYQAKAVIVATGSQHRKLGVPGEEEFAGRGVSYCATCDGFFFRNKPIVVVGGGDSAMEEADFLSRFGSSVTIVHRRGEFRASKIMVERAQQNPKIRFELNATVSAIHGDDQSGATEVELTDVTTGETRVIPANGVFVAIGQIPQTEFLGGAVETAADGTIKVDGASSRTSAPGVFAAGDNADAVYQQAITAAGMGCRAALDAQAYLIGE
ncbi:thioredoxin-disulfide reductase [Bifidobacterium sp. SMB2]|uniref:Thioredoxin reductase n=1 Tax=Bifidobacterium saimiriisciurei TaxID=2661627 RepID=A0ABX0C965_9BIFI|nr:MULTISPECIES: thioredoxin-disulfide reductase [Bifidobacterium]NEG95519.1 thioredoxin-disulfide reductase [Bifidobacterium sp. SMB2]NEH11677.1 thioredoxin-disulfide reductase [Bifidobacterium saimiriisciurei]